MPANGKVAVTGASGLVGRALVAQLRAYGYEPMRLVRRTPRSDDEVYWDPAGGTIDTEGLAGVAGVVHLAGDNIADGRWTESKKARIRESRVEGTKLLVRALAELDPRPRVLVSASAVGFYGTRGDEAVDESSSSGEGFLASVCREWEAAADRAQEAGIRVVKARLGVILASEGGALAKMKTPFLLGLGGRIGDGAQYMSWITLDDAVSALIFALRQDDLVGPVNVVAPNPVTNAEFTSALGRVLHRPTVIPIPKFALRLGAGAEMADEMLIGGVRALPASLEAHGFEWAHPNLEAGLKAVL